MGYVSIRFYNLYLSRKHFADFYHLFGCMDEDCVDACMPARTLGGGSDALALQMQCMVFVILSSPCVPFLCPDTGTVLTALCVWVLGRLPGRIT
jgi:hypothetical protein